MNRQAKKMLLAVNILALLTALVSGCIVSDVAGDVDEPAEMESGQAEQAAGVEEEVSAVDPENIPSEEERNAILDQVNRGGPILEGNDEQVDGPVPGTESGPGDE